MWGREGYYYYGTTGVLFPGRREAAHLEGAARPSRVTIGRHKLLLCGAPGIQKSPEGSPSSAAGSGTCCEHLFFRPLLEAPTGATFFVRRVFSRGSGGGEEGRFLESDIRSCGKSHSGSD